MRRLGQLPVNIICPSSIGTISLHGSDWVTMDDHIEAMHSDGEDRKPAPHGTSQSIARPNNANRSESANDEAAIKSDDDGSGAPSRMLRDERHPPIPMLTARKREYKTLEELDAMADELRVAPMPSEEKSRQMGLIYSRRKRLRKQKRIEELMIQRDEIRSDISRLRNENDRLRRVRQTCLEELSSRLRTRHTLESLQREQFRPDLIPASLARAAEADALMTARLYPPGSASLITTADSFEGLQRLRIQQALTASLTQRSSQLGPNPSMGLNSLRSPIAASTAIGPAMDVGAVRPRGVDVMTQLAAARELEGARHSHRALFSALTDAQTHYSNLQRSVLGAGRGGYYSGLPLEPSFLSPPPAPLHLNDDLVRYQDRLERLPPAELSSFLDNLRVRTSPMEKILEEFERKRAAK
jgi:hypothetical protein